MNLLSHAVFASICTGSDGVVFGAMMKDLMIKGVRDETLPKEVADGKKIHNRQDEIFDSRTNLIPFRDELFSIIRHFQNPVLDVICDHIVACNWPLLFEEKLEDYTKRLYEIIVPRMHLIESKKRQKIMLMIENDVLASYRTEDGLETGLIELAGRSEKGQVIKDNISGIMDLVPKVEPIILGVLPDVYRESQSHLRELGYQPEGRLLYRREGFLSGEIFNRPNPERR